jgi:MinD-like ATPase involved in chromosome partitioning or flagellar assembly
LEQELAGEIGRESRLGDVLNNFSRHGGIPPEAGKSDYDYILIDCPPNLGILTVNAICAATEIIVPVEASRFSFEGLNQVIEVIGLIGERLNHKVIHRILVVNFDSRLRHSFKMLETIKETFKDRLYGTIIHVNVKLKEAQSMGMHILNYDKYCRGAKDYFSLSRELIIQEQEKPASAGVVKLEKKLEEKKAAKTIEKAEKIEKIEKIEELVKPEELEKPEEARQAEQKVEQMEKIDKKLQEIVSERIPQLSSLTSEIIFSLSAPQAKEVHIAGDFNDWKLGDASRMEKDNGSWRKRISLSSGKYRYRFVIDGSWTEDPGNPQKEVNPYGSADSLIEVKEKQEV